MFYITEPEKLIVLNAGLVRYKIWPFSILNFLIAKMDPLVKRSEKNPKKTFHF